MIHLRTRDGVQLYTKIWGQGRPVVLLHGWPLSADSWDEVAMALADAGYQTIAYDRRGFGRSEQPWSGYDYDTLSDDLADVMNELKVADATLVGFSMGGGEVARYMSRHLGKNVRSTALIASIVPYMLKTDDNPHGVDASVFAQMKAGMTHDRASFFAEFFKHFFGVTGDAKPVSPEVLQWAQALAMQASFKATLACAEAFAQTDFRPDLSAFGVPTLILHGTSDATVPIDCSARAAAAAIVQSTLIEYEGAPHGLFATHKQKLISDLNEFLKH
ncbi:MAG: alpha/beta fold hydrolase [Planctomycetaceae bacterium]